MDNLGATSPSWLAKQSIMETTIEKIEKEESTSLRAARALEHIANSLEGLGPGIPQLLKDLQLSNEELYFLLYGTTLITKVLKRVTARTETSSR